jgi:putative hemolysin
MEREAVESEILRLDHYPVFPECIPASEVSSGCYTARFARSAADLDAICRLRYEVFNLEFGGGLDTSRPSARDVDEFDTVCHHLLIEDNKSGEIIGTYRMQTVEMARAHGGFYSEAEFDLAQWPDEILRHAVELGRACIAQRHRSGRVLILLWRGLIRYLAHNRKRYLFGCACLTSQDPDEACAVLTYLRERGYMDAPCHSEPLPGFGCEPRERRSVSSSEIKLPVLMQFYLTYGMKISGPPAIDRAFKTIDYLGILDVDGMDARTRAVFFRPDGVPR